MHLWQDNDKWICSHDESMKRHKQHRLVCDHFGFISWIWIKKLTLNTLLLQRSKRAARTVWNQVTCREFDHTKRALAWSDIDLQFRLPFWKWEEMKEAFQRNWTTSNCTSSASSIGLLQTKAQTLDYELRSMFRWIFVQMECHQFLLYRFCSSHHQTRTNDGIEQKALISLCQYLI